MSEVRFIQLKCSNTIFAGIQLHCQGDEFLKFNFYAALIVVEYLVEKASDLVAERLGQILNSLLYLLEQFDTQLRLALLKGTLL